MLAVRRDSRHSLVHEQEVGWHRYALAALCEISIHELLERLLGDVPQLPGRVPPVWELQYTLAGMVLTIFDDIHVHSSVVLGYDLSRNTGAIHISLHPQEATQGRESWLSHQQFEACRALAATCEHILEAADPGQQRVFTAIID